MPSKGQLKLLALPSDLYAAKPSYGMTGTTEGATPEQMATLAQLCLEQGLDFLDEFYWHFGDAIGADEQAFNFIIDVYPFSALTIAHPGVKVGVGEHKRAHCKAMTIREPMEMIARNTRIAYLSHNGLFALPRQYNEILRSGTWATVRTAGALKRPTWIIKPNGLFDYYPEGYKTELRRETLYTDEAVAWGL